MATDKTKLENIRNYSVFIGITFLIVFFMRDNGKNLSMGLLLSMLPFAVAIFTTIKMKKG